MNIDSIIGMILKEVASLGALTSWQYILAVFVVAIILVVARKIKFPSASEVPPADPEKQVGASPPMDMPSGGMPVPPPDHDYSKDP